MNKPTRPEVVRVGLTPSGAQSRRYCYASEVEACITAIEQERDEAVAMLRQAAADIHAYMCAADNKDDPHCFAHKDILNFLARIEGGDND